MEKVTYNTPIVPRQVRLELTNFCPYQCVFCHRRHMTREVGYISTGLVEKVIEDIRAFPMPLAEVVPQGWGECFAHPEWFAILELLARKLPSTGIVIPTNGSYLSESVVDRLAQIRTLKVVNLSLNAFFPEVYSAIHGVSPQALERAPSLTQKLRRLRPDVRVWASMVYDSHLQSPLEKEMFEAYWNGLLGAGTAQVVWNQSTGLSAPEKLVPVNHPCRSLFSDMVVLYDGTVATGCCFDAQGHPELVVGHVNRGHLLDHWHSKRYAEIRQLHNQGQRGCLTLCRNCSFA